MQVLFVLRFYYPDKTDHWSLNACLEFRLDYSAVKQLLYVLKLFPVISGCIHSFWIHSKETLRIMYPKYVVLNMIQRIHLSCGSFGSTMHFWILVKERNISVFGLQIWIWTLVKKWTLISCPEELPWRLYMYKNLYVSYRSPKMTIIMQGHKCLHTYSVDNHNSKRMLFPDKFPNFSSMFHDREVWRLSDKHLLAALTWL